MRKMDKADLVVLLESDLAACEFYAGLAREVRTALSQSPEGIGTLDDLKARAQQLQHP
ncbi:MAG: hypothetical protein RR296_12800 [Clostridia bacterium]